MAWEAVTRKLAALVLVIALAEVLHLTYAAYRGDFRPAAAVTIESGRAGLAVRPGALVKRHGVEVGRVAGVGYEPGGAVVQVRIDRNALAAIPFDTRADIASTTVFGEKYIILTDPPRLDGDVPGARSLAAGATIHADSVTVEIDSVFESLTNVLRAVDPAKLNVTLSALADALRGQGRDLGQAVDDANILLARIDPRLPQLRRDIRATADTAGIYADATDDLAHTLTNASTTADTLVQTDDTLDRVLLATIGMADTGNQVLTANADPLTTAITLLDPTTALLAEYSPEITCFLQGADVARKLAEPVSGGNGASMLLRSTLLLGASPYTYPADLPVVRASGGPRCGALPARSATDLPAPYVVADTGANPFAGGSH